jgi:hypothetical protein
VGFWKVYTRNGRRRDGQASRWPSGDRVAVLGPGSRLYWQSADEAAERVVMKVNRSSAILLRSALAVWVGLVPAACDSPASPTVRATGPAPSAVAVPTVDVPPGPPVAVLAVEEFTLFRDYNGNLVPDLRLAETSGQSAAVVISLEFNLLDGAPWIHPAVWTAGRVVPAGARAAIEPEVIYGDYAFTFQAPLGYAGRVSVLMSFADEHGRRGTLNAVAALPR